MELEPIIMDATKDDMDAAAITMLATEWGLRLPRLAELKLFKDGRELVDAANVPDGVSPDSAPVYRLMRHIGSLNLARRISESVTDRQQPNGFRKVSNRDMRDTTADSMYHRCGMDTLLRRNLFPDTGDYGEAFAYVGPGRGRRLIQAWSPWHCHMAADEDSAIHYSYDQSANTERLRLYRLERDQYGDPTRVRSRLAVRTHGRTVPDPSDDMAVLKTATDDTPWQPGNDWQWADGEETDYAYAAGCESLPIVRISTPDGRGLYEPHLPALKRIDRQIFDRLCISMMQAFRQRAIKGTLPAAYTAEDAAVIAGAAQEGDPIDYASILAMGPAALWQLPDGVDIWESQTTDMSGLQNSINADIKQLAAAAGIPLDILSPDVQGSASGAELKRETLKFKVQNLNALASEAIVRMVRMALVLDGDASARDDEFELMWKPMVSNSRLELAQAAQLYYQSGLMSRRTVLTKELGFTAQDVAEDDMNRMADQLTFTQPNTATMPAALPAATGWNPETGTATDGLPQDGDMDTLEGTATFR